MRQYSKIYVPNDLGFYGIHHYDDETDGPIHIDDADKVENVICLTIEELREVWEAAEERVWHEAGPHRSKDEPPDFGTFLTSKGIK